MVPWSLMAISYRFPVRLSTTVSVPGPPPGVGLPGRKSGGAEGGGGTGGGQRCGGQQRALAARPNTAVTATSQMGRT